MDAFLERFINATAWTMTKPAAYGPFHLIFAIVGLAVSFLLARACESWATRETAFFF